jgi:bacterioferritin-associated ferredoxin
MAMLCHCHVVTEGCIEDAVLRGASTAGHVEELCGAGAACGGCLPAIEGLLAELTARLDGAAA